MYRVGIEKIKDLAQTRTPEKMTQLFEEQKKAIALEIKKLEQITEMMDYSINITRDISSTDIDQVQVIEKAREPIFLGPITKTNAEEDAITEFYDFAAKNGVLLSYPLGLILTKDNLLENKFEKPQRYYFKIPFPIQSWKPAGRYVVGYYKGNYTKYIQIYNKLLDFIKANQLEICGNCYEEWPLNEISNTNPEDYLSKIEIMVK